MYQSIECFGAKLNMIPTGVAPEVTILSISKTNVSAIKDNTFPSANRLQEVLFKGNGISEIDRNSFVNLRFLKHLDLGQNRLTMLDPKTFDDLQTLESLDLGDNLLANIQPETFAMLPHLKALDLACNRLQEICYDCLSNENHRLEQLYIGRNRWKCDCAFGNGFKNWASEHNFVIDYHMVTCYKDDGTSESLNTVDLKYCDSKWYITAICVCSSLLVVLGLLVAMYEKREWIMVFVFYHFGIRLTKSRELDGKEFDAFISFCSADGFQMVRTLLDVLENTPPYYKLCIHQRDWLAGGWISENIIGSIRSSRRVVVFLTEKYVTSQWCMFEFQRAHAHFLEDMSTRILVVVKEGELPHKDLLSR